MNRLTDKLIHFPFPNSPGPNGAIQGILLIGFSAGLGALFAWLMS